METVENADTRPPVIIGYGTIPQKGALMTAGAERVFTHPDDLPLFMDYPGVSLRAHDTLLMVQPKLIHLPELKTLWVSCDKKLILKVVGNNPFVCRSEADLRAFQAQKPKGVATALEKLTGRPGTVDYTLEQAEAIIRLWHQKPKIPPRKIVIEVATILNVDADKISVQWVKDLVIKFVGTAKRDCPENWKGVRDA